MSLPDSQPEPTIGRPGWHIRAFRLLTGPTARLQATGVLMLVAIGVGAAWLLPPSNVIGDLPGDDALGKLSTVTIKANRDYTIPDPDATAALRADAARQVRSVYDLDVGAGDEARARVEGAFASAREALQVALTATPARATHGRSAAAVQEENAIVASHMFYGDFIKQLQAVVDESEYEELVRLRFDETIEKTVVTLAQGILANEVSPSREILLAERQNGITIRQVGTPLAQGEQEVQSVDRIPDVNAVRTDLTRFAQGLPELPSSHSGVTHAAQALPPSLDPVVRRAAALLAARVIEPNLVYNAEETEYRKLAAAAAVKPVVVQYVRGEQIVAEGKRIEKRHLLVFHFMRDQARALDIVQVRTGAIVFTLLLVTAAFSLARRTVQRFRPSKRDLVFLAAALIGNLAALRAGLSIIEQLHHRPAWLTNDLACLVLPLAAGTMLVRMLRSGESAVVYALVIAPLIALQLNSHVPAAVSLVASLVAANRLGGRGGRSALLMAGVEAGLSAAASAAALALYSGHLIPDTAFQGLAAFVGGAIVSPLTALLVAPLVEVVFGYVSEARLLRLANLNSPVLKELIIRAPGTYHHSLIVGSLAEAGARASGAHPLLARVGGYYHDLGKADAPLMFGENQRGENRLEKLPPREAAATVMKHVTNGVARAKSAHLPRVIIDFITQHHGTNTAGNFLDFARSFAEHGGLPAPDPAAFHYAGPKPRSREIALVMLADSVEAASRSLADPTAERLRALAAQVVREVVRTGQLDECDLTLVGVERIISAFQEVLVELHSLSRVDVLPGYRPPPTATPAIEVISGEPPIRAIRP